MKKILLILLWLAGLAPTGFAQNAFYDAKLLYTLDANELDTLDAYKDLLLLQADKDDWRNLRSFIIDPLRYISEEKPGLNVRVIRKLQLFKQQYRIVADRGGRTRFERKYSTTFDLTTAPQGLLDDVASGVIEVLFGSGLGAGLNTRIVDATTSLLLNRAESELTLSFFARLKEEFENRPFFIYSENKTRGDVQIDTFRLRNIFQATYALISDYDQVISINIGKSLQNAFEEDLRIFFSNAERYMVPAHLKQNIVYQVYSIVHQTFNSLSLGEHPSVILSALAEQYAMPESYNPRTAIDTFNCAIQLLESTSQHLRDMLPGRVWVSTNDFKQLNVREREYFLSLYYLDNRVVLRKLGINGARFQLGERSSDFVRLQQLIFQNLTFLEQVENKIADLRLVNAVRTDRTPGAPEVQRYSILNNSEQDRQRAFREYAFMFAEVVQHIGAYACWANRNSFVCSQEFQEEYLPVARELLQVPFNVEIKEYSAAFLKTLRVIETLHRDNPLYQTPQGFIRYLSLAADIVAADDANRVRAIVNEVTLPVGSYRVKRYSSSSVYVSALVGAGFGGEWLDNPAVRNKWAAQVSPFAPIGIDVNWGARKLLKNTTYTTKGTSNGVFFSIIDLGVVTSYRFQMESRSARLTSANLPTIKLGQVLSPGAFYTHGFRNSPIVWGLGLQLTPRLRDIVDAKTTVVDRANAFRFSTFVAIDLPLFNIATRNDRLPKFDGQAAKRELDKMMLQRDIDNLSRQLFRASSTDERRRLQEDIKRKEKQLKKGK